MEVEETLSDRQGKYGHPAKHFKRTADLLTAIGVRVWDEEFKVYRHPEPEDWGLWMILDKMAREYGPGLDEDNVHDMQGYARCVEMVREYYQEEKESS